MTETETSLFDRLGGIRKMAALVGRPPSTVQSWKTEGRIPAKEQPDVIEKACAAGFEITAEDVVFPLGKPNPAEAAE
jgi:DNA-binding transcriptional regulator YdaS (Cro superfamily)